MAAGRRILQGLDGSAVRVDGDLTLKSELIGNSPGFHRMRNLARMVAATDVGLLLLGEPGSGRTALAREVHSLGPRRNAPWVALVCVGASRRVIDDAIEAAGEGTLYLGEVAELEPEAQARLLNLLIGRDQGGRGPRVIAASALDLGAAVAAGHFRRDLHLRLCVVPIDVPPLRERLLDVSPLTTHFISQAANRHQVAIPRLSAGAERLFRRHHWPGNLRELENLCERLVILCPGGVVRPEDLPAEMISGQTGSDRRSGFVLPPQGIDFYGLEAELLRQALALAGGNKSRAARLLGLSRDTFLYRMQKHLIPA
jgi:DNA-binding NtrC family response regulator